MLKFHFDPPRPYRVVIYARMSSDQQNRRSPEQQIDEINRRLQLLGYPWVVVKVYRDDAVSGRVLRKRRDYQRMLREIKSGTVSVDLILADTLERFGRVEDLPGIRKELFEKYGVLVLTADSNFADPTTPQGKALGMFEAMRAYEDGRIKAHNVLRGKRDAARQGHWPGGPPPFGYRLQSVMKCVHGRQEVDHCVLVPNPETRGIVALAFNTALATGLGATRLARFLNDRDDIPQELKPFQPSTIGYWLDNPIYVGELVWAANSTGIVDDVRVVQPNAPEDVIRVPGFCDPLVPRATYDAVQKMRQARRQRLLESHQRKAAASGKLIAPPAPGLALKYLLTGLVRCGHCGRAMTPSSSPVYVAKSGEERRYTSYVCPGHSARICPNHRRIPERWLREVVIGKLRERLFPLVS
jgi:DNA invertase Pin-like site-specific DNA recombinase